MNLLKFFGPKSTEVLAKEAYSLGRRLGILSEEALEDFISKEDIEKINEREREVKKVNPHLPSIREEDIGYRLLDMAEKKGKAFSMD